MHIYNGCIKKCQGTLDKGFQPTNRLKVVYKLNAC